MGSWNQICVISRGVPRQKRRLRCALSRRLRESQARLQAVLPLLPPAMRASVKAGPIDEAGWTLLASNGAVSAKLRQLVPALEAQLRSQGWQGPPVRVKMLSPG